MLQSGFSEAQERNLTLTEPLVFHQTGVQSDQGASVPTRDTNNSTDLATTATESTLNVSLRIRTIIIQNFDYETYSALLHFMHTDQLNFAPLLSRSRSTSTSLAGTASATSTSHAPSVSSKSLYRLAHLLDHLILQRKCLNHFKANLTVFNVIEELFGEFCRDFVEARKVAMEFAVANRQELSKGKVIKQIKTKVMEEDFPFDEGGGDDEDDVECDTVGEELLRKVFGA